MVPSNLTNLCIIYYYGNKWDEQSCRQCSLPRSLSRYAHVIFLDGGSERTVSTTHIDSNLTIVKGLSRVLQALRRRNMHILASWYARWHLRWVKRKFGRVVFWYSEHSQGFHNFIPHDTLIYDCVDPCFSDDLEAQRKSEKAERELLTTAHHVFATADTLLTMCEKHNSSSTLLNNACDPAELAPDLLASAHKPVWWPQNGVSIASYFGGVNERVDLEALEVAFSQNSDVHFIVAGPIHDTLSKRVEVLSQFSNVTFTGAISVEAMRYLFANSSVMLIPFKMNPIGDAINPQKMYAYSLLGKPIIGLATWELAKWKNVVFAAKSKEEFSLAISSFLRNPQPPEQGIKLRTFGLANTWDKRAEEAWEVVKAL